MIRSLFGFNKHNRFTIKSSLLLRKTPYFYTDTLEFTFGKEESFKFGNLFGLINDIQDELLRDLNNDPMVINATIRQNLKHINVWFCGVENLTRPQYKKYLGDINDTLNMLENCLFPNTETKNNVTPIGGLTVWAE